MKKFVSCAAAALALMSGSSAGSSDFSGQIDARVSQIQARSTELNACQLAYYVRCIGIGGDAWQCEQAAQSYDCPD